METSNLLIALGLIATLQVKHLVCDGPLQTLAMVQAKRHYGRPQGLLHAAIHGVGTLVVILLWGAALLPALAIAAAETALHYHIDFAKENLIARTGWNSNTGPFWWVYCADQMLHHMSYLVVAWFAVTA